MDELEVALRERGMMLGPLAAHKETGDGRFEVGSWVHFGKDVGDWPKIARLAYLLVVPYQLHITIFPASDDGGYILTAHYEWSAYSPLWAYWHLRKKYYDEAEGVCRTSYLFSDADGFVPTIGPAT